MKISQVFKHFKERKGSQVERTRGRRRERGARRLALQMSPATWRHPGITGLYPGPPEKGGLELGPTRNLTRTEPEFEFSAKRRWSVSNPQLRLKPFDQIPASRTRGLEKRGRIGRVKERKERGKGRESIKSLVPYRSGHSGQLSVSGEDQGQKGPSCGHWVWSIGRQANPWIPQVVRMSAAVKKSPHQSCHLLQQGEPLPGPKTRLLSNTWKWIVQGDTCADKRLYWERKPGWRAGG